MVNIMSSVKEEGASKRLIEAERKVPKETDSGEHKKQIERDQSWDIGFTLVNKSK